MLDTMTDLWRSHFDHIYCFSFLPNKKRREAMVTELKRVGIWDSGIFSFVYTSPDPWEACVEALVPRISQNGKTNTGFINLGLASARTFREALGLDYKRVLFLEDDIRFRISEVGIQKTIEDSPWTYNIIQYDKFVYWCMTRDDYNLMVGHNYIGDGFFDGGEAFLPSGACFCADTTGMEAMLRSLEDDGPRPVDGLFGTVGVKRAVADINLAVQVLFQDGLVNHYIGVNSHHTGYRPQGLKYSIYNVPEGYGYDTKYAIPCP